MRSTDTEVALWGCEMAMEEKKSVLLVNGSPHKNGNTAAALKEVESALNENGVDTVWFQLNAKPVRGCIGCGNCAREHRCAFSDDQCNELIEAFLKADGIVIGTPVYFAGPNGALLALLDRTFYATANFGQLLRGKVAAAVATCWRAGATPSIDRINKYFMFSQMPIVSSDYWNGYLGGGDGYGRGILRTLGENMAKML